MFSSLVSRAHLMVSVKGYWLAFKNRWRLAVKCSHEFELVVRQDFISVGLGAVPEPGKVLPMSAPQCLAWHESRQALQGKCWLTDHRVSSYSQACLRWSGNIYTVTIKKKYFWKELSLKLRYWLSVHYSLQLSVTLMVIYVSFRGHPGHTQK